MKNDLHIFELVVYDDYNYFTVRRRWQRCNALDLQQLIAQLCYDNSYCPSVRM